MDMIGTVTLGITRMKTGNTADKETEGTFTFPKEF
jgi:predicted RecA/RadA family phage recombinase